MERRNISLTAYFYNVDPSENNVGVREHRIDTHSVSKLWTLMERIYGMLKSCKYNPAMKYNRYDKISIFCKEVSVHLSISPHPCPKLDCDIEYLTGKSKYVSWMLHHIEANGIAFRDIRDAEQFVSYLITNNETISDFAFVNANFHNFEKMEIRSYHEMIAYRKELIAKGQFNPQYLYEPYDSKQSLLTN